MLSQDAAVPVLPHITQHCGTCEAGAWRGARAPPARVAPPRAAPPRVATLPRAGRSPSPPAPSRGGPRAGLRCSEPSGRMVRLIRLAGMSIDMIRAVTAWPLWTTEPTSETKPSCAAALGGQGLCGSLLLGLGGVRGCCALAGRRARQGSTLLRLGEVLGCGAGAAQRAQQSSYKTRADSTQREVLATPAGAEPRTPSCEMWMSPSVEHLMSQNAPYAIVLVCTALAGSARPSRLSQTKQ